MVIESWRTPGSPEDALKIFQLFFNPWNVMVIWGYPDLVTLTSEVTMVFTWEGVWRFSTTTGSVINAVLDVLSPKATNQGDENITKVNLGQPLYRCGTAPQAPGNKFTHHTQRPTQVNVNAENVRKTGSPQHFHNMQNNIPAQPLLDSVYPQMPGHVNSQHNQQYRPGHNSSATGANRAPVWVSESYNIRTQNRFSAVSGN